jgi:hypothetical protein
MQGRHPRVILAKFDQRRLQLPPKGIAWNNRGNRHKGIAFFVETFGPSVQIENTKLSHAELPRSKAWLS